MPVLLFDDTPKRFILPSSADKTDQAWVEMTTYPLCADDYHTYYDKKYSEPVAGQPVLEPSLNAEVLSRRIKTWNYTDGTGAPLPITAETIGHLQNADQLFLVNCIEAAVAPEPNPDPGGDPNKKKETSSPTSSTPPTATQ